MRTHLLSGILILLCACTVSTERTPVRTTNDYASYMYVMEPGKEVPKHQLAVILLHCKRCSADDDKTYRHAVELASDGYKTLLPHMPWSSYNGTFNDAMDLIDTLAGQLADEDKRVVVMGHSMGATLAFLYGVRKPHPAVAGVIMEAPGHILHASMKIQEASALDVQKARRLVSSGQGGTPRAFHDLNQGSKSSITTTPEIYLSFFDPRVFPNLTVLLDEIKLPVLWIDGAQDRVAARLGYQFLANRLAKHPLTRHMEVPGGHVDMAYNTYKAVHSWLMELEKSLR